MVSRDLAETADELGFEEAPRRPRIVFVPGLGGVPDGWASVEVALSTRFDVAVVDDEALNDEARSRTGALSRDLNGLADDLAAVVRSDLTAGPVGLVGQSMGAWICLCAAARHPDLVAAVVAGAPPVPDRYLRAMFELLRDLASSGHGRQFRLAAQLLSVRRHRGVAGRLPAELPETTSGRGPAEPVDAEAYARKVEALLGADLDLLSRVRAPVRVLAGGLDAVAPPWQAREIARLLPASEVVVLADASHSLIDDLGDIYLDLTLTHFARHGPG